MPSVVATEIATDASGDPVLWSSDGSLPPLVPVGDAHVDLDSLYVGEDAGGFNIEVRLHEPGIGPASPSGQILVYFNHGSTTYQLDFSSVDAGGQAGLYSFDVESGQRRFIAALGEDGDRLRSFVAYVPRQYILDEDGSPPFPGRILDNWRVLAHGSTLVLTDAYVTFQDQMPDSGVAEAVFPVAQGATGSGHLRLFSSRPLRGSNGEATTFLYPVVAANDGREAQTIVLEAQNVPLGWQVTFQPHTFALQPGEQLAIPVISSIPFRHQHGASESFRLTMTAPAGEASLDIGVSYFEVPQPAGHHNTLWMHSKASGTSRPTDAVVLDQSTNGFMNTLEEDPESTDAPIPGTVNSALNTEFRWTLPLDPGLQLGLDFDLTSLGMVSTTFRTDVPILDGQLTGFLMLVRGEEDVFLGNLTPIQVALDAQSQATIETPFVPDPNADFILDEGRAAVFLRLVLSAGRPVTNDRPEAPVLLPGSYLTLPLHEYRDPVAPELLTAAQSEIQTQGELQRKANAGDGILFNLTVKNTSPVAIRPEISFLGLNQDWARILGASQPSIQSGQSYPLAIAVQIPPDAVDGMAADFFVSIDSGFGAPSLARLVVLVDETTDHPSDQHLIDEMKAEPSNEAPLTGVPVQLLALVAALLALRRRGEQA